ncbi:hypothetical protein JHK87_039499 [Glycine soja]|nr:hypothetical protein JHK87_039499 [Glycine soja]
MPMIKRPNKHPKSLTDFQLPYNIQFFSPLHKMKSIKPLKDSHVEAILGAFKSKQNGISILSIWNNYEEGNLATCGHSHSPNEDCQRLIDLTHCYKESFYHASAMAKQLEAQQQQEIMTRIT